MKNRLIFHFYLTDNWLEQKTNKIHLCCLKYFANIFNEMTFVIVIDDLTNTDLIYGFEDFIINLKVCTNINFIVKHNTVFRDSQTFYDEIVSKIDKLDGLTFFGHNKGLTNYTNPVFKRDDVEKWITTMYYGCFSDVQEMEYALTEDRCVGYGTLLSSYTLQDDKTKKEHSAIWFGKERYQYMGTFFWINCQTLCAYMKNTEKSLPIMADRWYAENFFSNIITQEYCGSFEYRWMINDYTFGKNMDYIINLCFEKETVDKYYDFHTFILNKTEEISSDGVV